MLSYQKTGKKCQRDFRAKKGSNNCVHKGKKGNPPKRKGPYVPKQPRRKLNGLPDMRFKANR
jgi:hypothetical protein